MNNYIIVLLYIIHYLLYNILIVYEIQGNIFLQDYFTFYSITVLIALRCVDVQ
jgi:hypothetical protein